MAKRRAHAANAASRRPRYTPTVVTDMAQLDAEIEAFLGPQRSRARRTRTTDNTNYRRWLTHCAAVSAVHGLKAPIDPMNAPWFVFQDLVLQRRQDGKPLAAGYVENIAAAVTLRYRMRTDGGPTVPAHRRPEHAGEWTDLLKGLRRKEAQRRAVGDPPQEPVQPLLREELLQLLRAEPPRLLKRDALRAAVLIALDTSLSSARLDTIRTGDVDLLDTDDRRLPRGVRVAGVELPCDHVERVRGVPHDCTACAVRAVMKAHSGDTLLFANGPASVAAALGTRRREWPWLASQVASRGGSALTPVTGLGPWEQAGLRRGLVLGAGYEKHQGFMWVRARAWTATGWVAGFRMVSDLSELARDRVEPAAAGDGYLVRLRGTKDDAPGEKMVVRPLEWSSTGGPSAGQAMAEYLAVRDAAVGGREGALLLTCAQERYKPLVATKAQAAKSLALLS